MSGSLLGTLRSVSHVELFHIPEHIWLEDGGTGIDIDNSPSGHTPPVKKYAT
jgi:hypothetical protein